MEGIWANRAFFLMLSLARYFNECHAQVCGKTEYTALVGYVTSPGFPSTYAHGLNCTNNLRASGQNSLTILYETIGLEPHPNCAYDWLEVWCSPNIESKRKICRIEEIRVISFASCNHAVIRFITDGSGSMNGFQFYYAFQRSVTVTSATTRTSRPTSLLMTTTVIPTSEATSASIISTEVFDTNDILGNIAIALGPNKSALLILVLACLFGLSLLSTVALFIILKCRSKHSLTVEGNIILGQEVQGQSEERYTLEPTEEIGKRKDGSEGVDDVRETSIDENDYELPDDKDDADDYMNVDEEENVDYENVDEINTVSIGRR